MISRVKGTIVKLIGEKNGGVIKYYFSFSNYNKLKQYKDTKKIIYLLSPIHGNMGDQAIAFATDKFLKDNFKDYKVLEFRISDVYDYGGAIKRILNKDDIIFLHGGGNMGNLYMNEENSRRLIISKFKYNKIISMPQTMSFTNDEEGRRELQRTKKVYNKHKDLTLIAREKYSYDMMKKEIKNAKVINNPDIVTYLHDMFEFDKENRIRIMTCLRSDKEGILGQDKDIFINELNKAYKDVFNYDTVVNKVIKKDTREKELNLMFDEFRKSKVVITDRLHGMIFCVITKTPCIVAKSLDHKVTGTYEWFKDLNYIKFVGKLDFNSVKPIIDELSDLENLNEINFKEIYFDKLREKLAL